MAIATITASNFLTKTSITSVTGLDSIRVTLTSNTAEADLTSLLTAFNQNKAPMLIGVGLELSIDGTIITFKKDGDIFKAYSGNTEYTGTLATQMVSVFNAFYDDRLPSIKEINEKLTTDLAGAVENIAELQTSLETLSEETQEAIGAPAKAAVPAQGEEGQDGYVAAVDAVEATGLYLAIDNAIASAVAGIEADIAKLVDDATQGQAPSTNSIAGLKAALAALTTVVGTPSEGQTAATGLMLTLEGLTAQVTELGSALSAGYNTAKLAYDAAVDAAAASKGLADTAGKLCILHEKRRGTYKFLFM